MCDQNLDPRPLDSVTSVAETESETSSAIADAPSDLKRLPKSTVKLITSTQVITSVFSVVKELIENALDAKATSIDIKLSNYGFDKIEVRDNGCGIKPTDTEFMAQPHYTSKITNTDDLEKLETYGFRGEALGSLCSVANVSITTKTFNDQVSMTYILSNEGKVMDTKPSHLGQGTTVSVMNLFQNLPVRRQFYSSNKKRKEEMKRVEDLVIACSIVSHDVRFSLKHNKDVIWQKNPVADVKSVLISVFGVNVMSQMEHVKRTCLEPEVEIEAFLPKPSAPSSTVTRSTNDRCFIFVNKRTVIMKDMEKVIRKLCNAVVGAETSRHPIAFIHIQLASRYVDVNLDPNKTRVFLRDKEKIMEFLTSILEELYRSPGKENKVLAIHDLRKQDNAAMDDTPLTQVDCMRTNPSDSLTENGLKISFGENIIKCGPESNHGLLSSNSSGQNYCVKEIISHYNAVNCDTGNTEKSSEQHSDVKSTGSSCEKDNAVRMEVSDLDLTLELLKEFEDNDEMAFDVSTPKLNRVSFGPLCTSTQATTTLCDTSSNDGGKQQENFDKGYVDNLELSDLRPVKNTSDAFHDNIDTKTSGSFDSTAVSGKQWAEGTAVKDAGKLVQPVQLLTGGPTLVCGISTSSTKLPTSNNAVSCNTPGPSKTTGNKNRLSVTPNQTTLFDMTIKKPPSAYRYFSKEVRPAVLADNPGCTFVDVAAIIVEKWKALSDEEQQKYEELAARDASWREYEEEQKDLKREREKSSSSKLHASKKRRLSKDDKQACIEKLFTPTAKSKGPVKPSFNRNEKPLQFSMQDLQESYQEGPCMSQSLTTAAKCLVLIGQVQSQSAWVCCHDNHLKLFQPIRAHEEIIYRRLMANHKFNMEPLESPIRLTIDYLGQSLWQTVLSLSMSAARATDPYNYITDTRITSNGFRIRHRTGTEEEAHQHTVEIVAMATSLASFDVTVLREILEMIQGLPNIQLYNCRPTIVKHFLQSEAVRMTRHLSNHMSRDEVRDLVCDLQCHLVGGTRTCFHGRPILHTLYDLDDIPRSQDSGLNATEGDLKQEEK